ncbi:hypothetical protein BKA70DRAFT_1424263 [Coprinopsis sp. MPI-PUGE-AT-0042]|nr:hypothetical protein BKA70DRAFT_1424263 [Coprinopsis sp. MPI-PUGE-AT-0042]
MKFTIIVAALALATGAAAQVDRQDAMRNLARSLIAEYEDFLEERAGGCQARSPQGTSGMECDPYSCDKYCVMDKIRSDDILLAHLHASFVFFIAPRRNPGVEIFRYLLLPGSLLVLSSFAFSSTGFAIGCREYLVTEVLVMHIETASIKFKCHNGHST